jgi:hypothetical protein
MTHEVALDGTGVAAAPIASLPAKSAREMPSGAIAYKLI